MVFDGEVGPVPVGDGEGRGQGVHVKVIEGHGVQVLVRGDLLVNDHSTHSRKTDERRTIPITYKYYRRLIHRFTLYCNARFIR